MVVPRAKVEFRAGAQVTSRGSPRSTAVGEDEVDYRAGKAVRFDSLVSWDIAQDGGIVSTTFTSKVADAEVLFEPSLAVHETWVVPTAKVLPDVGAGNRRRRVDRVGREVTTNVTEAPLPDVASFVIGPGTDTVGGIWSATVTLKVFRCRRVVGGVLRGA